MPLLNRGILIAIEGIDGSGKSTLARNIATCLEQQGFDIALTREPGQSELGKEIRTLVQAQNISISPHAQYLLFAADRAQHFDELIIPALKKNTLIISDRMSDSSLAYQGYGNGLDLQMIKQINAWSMRTIVPDLTIFVRIPIDVALERCSKRGALSAYEKKDFLQKVAAGFEELYKNRGDVIIVDGTESPENLNEQLCKDIEQWIEIKKLIA